MAQNLKDLLTMCLARMEDRATGRELPIPTPWENVNNAIGGGLWCGETYVLVGNSGSGKTQLAMQAAIKAAMSGIKVCYLCLELSPYQLGSRILGLTAGVDWSPLFLGQDSKGIAAARIITEKIQDLPIIIETAPAHGWDYREMPKIVNSVGKRSLVILDYLQLVGGPEYELRERIKGAAYTATQLSIEYDSAMMLISSTARENYDKLDERNLRRPPAGWRLGSGPPSRLIGTGKESGDIEYSAGNVLVIGIGVADTQNEQHYLVVAKQRAGIAQWLSMEFDGLRWI